MPIFIEQNAEEVKLSFNLQKHAEIVSVYLTGASMDSDPAVRKYGPNLIVSVGHKSTAEPPVGGLLLTHIDFALSASPKEKKKTEVFGIRCSFDVTYALEKGYQPEPEEIQAFSSANAVFNAWPYFREFVQSGCLRMGLPGDPAVPFLKLVPKAPDREPEKTDGLMATPLQAPREDKPRKTTRATRTKNSH